MKYFIYCRKSSEDDDRQMLSIDGQLSELNVLAQTAGLSIVHIFTENKSAKGPGREVFNEMIRRIEKGEADAILSWKLDRLARNFDDGGKIIGLLQRGVIREIRTFEKSYLPTDNVLMIAVELGMANQYVRDLSLNIRRGIREKLRRGVFSGKAPLGYYNEPRLRTIEPHPEKFEKMKCILELFATGEYSLTAIQREMAKVGLVSRDHKPLALASIGHILRRHFYYGAFLYNGEMHQGTHVPMISKKTFDEVQAALVKVAKPRKRSKDKGFNFLGFATCGCCGYCITGERKIKKSGLRFIYYRCTYKSKVKYCENRTYTSQLRLESEIKRNMELVSLPDEIKERFLAKVETWETEVSDEKQLAVDAVKAQLTSLRLKIDRLNNAFADGSLAIDEFKEMKNPLVPKKVELEQRLISLEKSKTNRLGPLRSWILAANQANNLIYSENYLEMKTFLKTVGSDHLLQSQTLTVSFKKPWNLLAQTNLAVRSTGQNFSTSSKWWSLLNEVRTYFDENPS